MMSYLARNWCFTEIEIDGRIIDSFAIQVLPCHGSTTNCHSALLGKMSYKTPQDDRDYFKAVVLARVGWSTGPTIITIHIDRSVSLNKHPVS